MSYEMSQDGSGIFTPPTLQPNPANYPASEAPTSELVERGRELGVVLDPTNALVLPDVTSEENVELLQSRIAPDLRAARDAIAAAKAAGKHVVYLPGSYDLVHAGHALYAQQVLDAYMAQTGCARQDIFLVMGVDDDALITAVKRSKWVGAGGEEPEPRPVEPIAERLLGVAASGADLAFPIPAPELTRADSLPAPVALDLRAMRADLETHFDAQQEARIDALVAQGRISEDMAVKERARIAVDHRELLELGLDAYAKLAADLGAWRNPGQVPVQAWQLYMHGILNDVRPDNAGTDGQRFAPGHVTRVVSVDDTKYLAQVVYLMNYANIAITLIEDVNVGSTTALLKQAVAKHGDRAWEAIRADKRAALREQFGATASDRYDAAVAAVRARLTA